MSKTPDYWQKIANIDREILRNFWTTWGISMKISRNMWLMIILKITKRQGLGPHYTRYFFWKTTKKGSNWPAPPLPPFSAALGLKQALNLILVLKKVHRFIEFNQEPLVKTIYWYEHRAKKKRKKWIWERFFYVHEQCSFWKNHGECEKI